MCVGEARAKMCLAAKMMLDQKTDPARRGSKSRVYEEIRLEANRSVGNRHRGKRRTPEDIERQRQSRIRTGANQFSEEHRAKIAEAARRKIKSPEEIAKFKATMQARQHRRSAEATAKMLETRRLKGPEWAEAVKAKWRESRRKSLLARAVKTPLEHELAAEQKPR